MARSAPVLPGTTLTREQAIERIRAYVAPVLDAVAEANKPPDIVNWAHTSYYIPETNYPIILAPHQRVFARMFADITLPATTFLYSTVKKSGKTAFAGVCSRFAAEYSGNKAEIYFIANDKDQAKDRAYESAKTSIELTPGYDRGRRVLPGRWKIIEKQALHEPTGSLMRAIAGDYEGAAGGNPTATFWTELWAFTTERFKRLWDEMTPVPTRSRSVRFVETYAGFADESELLYDLYNRAVKRAQRLTRDDLQKYADPGTDPWPHDDDPPFYINPAAGTIAYWDEGPAAQRRMPWQTSERGVAYYREQEANLRPEAYERLHLNYWVSSAQSFIQPAWWVACKSPTPDIPPKWPMVLAVDGSVSSDCTAAVLVCREPVRDPNTGKLVPSDTDVRQVAARVWFPPRGGAIDLLDVEQFIRDTCAQYNVVEVAYDAYQLALMMQRLTKDGVAWCRPFSQAGDREIADKQLYDAILYRTIHHDDQFDRDFINNAAAYVAGENAKQNDKLRIVKRSQDEKIDPVVALSMANAECRRLLLGVSQ